MDKIKLTSNAKRILLALSNEEYVYIDSDEKDLILLEQEELVDPCWTNDGPFPSITNKGIAYVHTNPKLKNPSIWDDKKYWITTGIAILALLASIGSIIFNIITRSNTSCG